MATYIPNATQTTEPVESRTVESAALEFRTLKASINGRIEDVQDNLDAEIVNRIAGDANLQTQNNAQDVRLQAIENALLSIGEGGLPGTVYVQRFSGTGVQTAFTLNAAPQSGNVVDIYINGIYQNKDTFSVAGAVITFSEAPPAGTDNIEVQVTVTIALGETDASLVTYGATTVEAQLDSISAAVGSNLVGFQQSGAGAVVRTAQDKLREYVSVKDFGAVGDNVADDTAAIQAALNTATDGTEIHFPGGVYRITSGLTCSANNLTLSGRGGYSQSMIITTTPSVQVLTVSGYGFKMRNLALRGDGGANGVGATVKGLRFVRGDGSKDVDAEIAASTIVGMEECVYMRGTNLYITDTLIGTSLLGVNFVRNGTDESRGLRIVNTRFHSIGEIGTPAKCIVLNADAFNCEIKSNFADSIYSFYEGPINGIEVDDNNCYRVSGPAINVLSATFAAQQRCGSVSGNLIFCNSPSYVGNAITLRMQNGQCSGNSIIGAREHAIQLLSTTASVIAENTILSPNFNAAVDGSIYDGINADSGSTANLITNNHIRSAGFAARSALNITNSNNVIGPNWVDAAYTTPYFTERPTLAISNSGIGIKKAASTSRVFDAIGRAMRIQQPDAVGANPVEYQAAFTVSGAEIQGAAIKFPVVSSGAGVEKVNAEVWVVSNGTMTKIGTFDWQGAFYLPALAAAPADPVTGMLALSNGTAGSSGWGSSGAGYYRWSGSAWVFVG